MYFFVDDDIGTGLWKSNGTDAGTVQVSSKAYIWEFDEVVEGQTILKCIKSKIWDGESSEGWFNFDLYKDYFEYVDREESYKPLLGETCI